MSVKPALVLAALSTTGQTYKQIQKKLGMKYDLSNIAYALCKLKRQNLAVSEKPPRPERRGKMVELHRRPRVLWRLKV